MVTEGKSQLRSVFFGGLLPLIAYSLVEEYYGVKWGLVTGMILGIGEIIFEKTRNGKVETITWIGNGLILGMGTISLFTGEGIWFRLQPAIIELGMAIFLMASVAMGKSLLVMMAEKQKMFERFTPEGRQFFESAFNGLTLRIGFFFLLHAALATWAAFYWSTRAWALLKGVGFTASVVVYVGIEIILLRRRAAIQLRPPRT
jgi:intracellular septation protein